MRLLGKKIHLRGASRRSRIPMLYSTYACPNECELVRVVDRFGIVQICCQVVKLRNGRILVQLLVQLALPERTAFHLSIQGTCTVLPIPVHRESALPHYAPNNICLAVFTSRHDH